MYNNNETPIIHEDKVNSSEEFGADKEDDKSIICCYNNGVWGPAVGAERERIRKKFDEFHEIINKLSGEVRARFRAQENRR